MNDFERGYICAVANLLRGHDYVAAAKDLLDALGKVDWRKVEPCDRALIRKAGLHNRKG